MTTADQRKRLRAARRSLGSGRLADAVQQILQVSGQAPGDAALQCEAGELLLAGARPDAAKECFLLALQRRPHDPVPLVGLGRAYLAEGDIPNAAGVGQAVTRRAPDHGPGHALHALVLRELWQTDEAYAAASKAVALCPEDPDALLALGNVALRSGPLDEAAEAFRLVTRIRPESGTGWRALGHTLARIGDSVEARAAFAKALERDAYDVVSRWARYRAVPPVHEDQESVERERARALSELEALEGRVKLRTPDQIRRAEAAIQDNFHFHYLGGDALALQRRHGPLVHRVMGAAHPEHAARPAMPAVSGRVRVGFASSCFRTHTVAKLFEGWLTGLDRERFEVFAYHLHPFVDETSERLRERVEHYAVETNDLDAMAKRIASDRLHVLVYPEIGMDRQVLKLAALHLAPLQCATFGHPVTTGLPSIDVMLSSALVESADADAHYTEDLVRLPGTGLYLDPPDLGTVGRTRASFGLPEDACLFLACQSLFKYLPCFDEVFARIAERAPNAHFVFIEHPHESVTEVFRERLARAFASRGTDSAERVTLLARLGGADYLDLNRVADVFLDSIDWSAGQSALEAIGCGLPVVTLPTEFARGRFTQAFLRRIGTPETIARSLDDYVEIAVSLGGDASRRKDLRARIEAGRGALYGDRAVMTALEGFLAEAVAARVPAPARSEPAADVHHSAQV